MYNIVLGWGVHPVGSRHTYILQYDYYTSISYFFMSFFLILLTLPLSCKILHHLSETWYLLTDFPSTKMMFLHGIRVKLGKPTRVGPHDPTPATLVLMRFPSQSLCSRKGHLGILVSVGVHLGRPTWRRGRVWVTRSCRSLHWWVHPFKKYRLAGLSVAGRQK